MDCKKIIIFIHFNIIARKRIINIKIFKINLNIKFENKNSGFNYFYN